MSVEDHQEPSSYNAGGESIDVSQIRPCPIISSSDSLEDGEIVEGRLSSISSRSLLQQSKDKLRPCLPNRGGASTTAFPTTAPTSSPAPAAESMTKEDLDRAKSLVLDLLGWGVTPEYLVECGLSPGAIYRIFTDLRLRLPSNLELLSPPPPHHESS